MKTIALSVLLLLSACALPPLAAERSAKALPQTASPAWAGSYRGLLPCAFCKALETTLVLNADGSYVLQERFLGQSSVLTTEAGGGFSVSVDGKILTLDKNGDGRKFQLGEGMIEQRRAEDGSKIDGHTPDAYVLKKIRRSGTSEQ